MKKNRLVATLVAIAFLSNQAWGQKVKSEGAFVLAGNQIDTLRGTFNHVYGKSKASGVLAMVLPGSGPTDRHGNNYATLRTNMYDLVCDVLNSQGISTLQADKRGVGKSTLVGGEESFVYSDNVSDYQAWWHLAQMKGYRNLILVGHSEGGQIALTWAASEYPTGLQALILLAPPGENAADILWEQLSRQIAPDSEYGQFAKTSLDSLREGYLLGRATPESLRVLLRPTVQPYMRAWFQDEPMENLNALSADLPIYVFYGGKDIQVQPSEAMRAWGAQNGPNAHLYH